jgi:hypothetical protein
VIVQSLKESLFLVMPPSKTGRDPIGDLIMSKRAPIMGKPSTLTAVHYNEKQFKDGANLTKLDTVEQRGSRGLMRIKLL